MQSHTFVCTYERSSTVLQNLVMKARSLYPVPYIHLMEIFASMYLECLRIFTF